MNEIKALEDMRDYITASDQLSWDGHKTTWVRQDSLLIQLDAIEAEIAEHYMELPVDADGVPIRVGDKMQYHGGEPFIVCAVAPCVIHTWMEVKLGERMTTYDYEPLQCTHYKPRTLEDVLHDVWKEALDYTKSDMWRNPDEVFAERADEIRELLGVE